MVPELAQGFAVMLFVCQRLARALGFVLVWVAVLDVFADHLPHRDVGLGLCHRLLGRIPQLGVSLLSNGQRSGQQVLPGAMLTTPGAPIKKAGWHVEVDAVGFADPGFRFLGQRCLRHALRSIGSFFNFAHASRYAWAPVTALPLPDVV